jgi:hypothetical protein
MRRWLLRLLLVLILAPLALLGVVLASLSDRPLVERAVDLSPESLARGQRIFDSNDPRKLKPGEIKTVQLSESELDLAANYLAHRYGHGSARLRLVADGVRVELSLALPAPWAGLYLNSESTLEPAASGLPQFARLRIGQLPVPGGLADFLAGRVLAAVNGQDAVEVISGAVKQAKVAGGQLTLVYQWRDDLPLRLSGAVIPAEDLERLRAYQRRLAEIGSRAPKGVSLAELLQPLLRLAGEQAAAGSDPAAENRAALVALTFYINHRGLDALVPGAEKWPQAALRTVKLNGRDDFPKHFIISAALAATADTPLADAIGLYKEVKDSRGGSGFSFNDIAADRAGARMGEMAVASADAALYLQQKAGASGLREADFMPVTQDLPEFMPEPEFKRRFGGIGEPKYELMMAEIERRIAELPLYQR